MSKVYIIKNIISGTALRNNSGYILMFVHPDAARNYISEHLPENLWEVSELRR